MTEYTAIRVKKDTHKRFKVKAAEQGMTHDEYADFLLDVSEGVAFIDQDGNEYELTEISELPGPEGAERPPVVVVKASE